MSSPRSASAALLLSCLLAACGTTPPSPEEAPRTEETAPPAAGPSAGATAPGTVAADAPPAVPPRAMAEFERAVSLMRAGNDVEAALELEQLTLAYPQLAAPHANLGILHRKGGRLDQAEAALRAAAERDATSAVIWNELGVTLRMAGKFQEAGECYERAIAADPGFAPAYRNLGVLLDLYLGDAEGALAAFERYQELTGEDKPVGSWIAELRQRTGKPAAPRPAPQQPADAAPHPEAAQPAGEGPAAAQAPEDTGDRP